MWETKEGKHQTRDLETQEQTPEARDAIKRVLSCQVEEGRMVERVCL